MQINEKLIEEESLKRLSSCYIAIQIQRDFQNYFAIYCGKLTSMLRSVSYLIVCEGESETKDIHKPINCLN